MNRQSVEKKRPLRTVEGKALEDFLLQAKDGDVVTFEEMSEAAGGFNYTGNHRHILHGVLARLRDEHQVCFESVRGVGYQRLANASNVEKAGKRHGRIARQADLGIRETVAANRSTLSEEGRRKYDANVHIFNVHKLFAKPDTVARTAAVASNKPLAMKMDEEFLKSMS